MKTIRWGILGAGRIARKFASDLKLVEGAELTAIGSRSKASAEISVKTSLLNTHMTATRNLPETLKWT